MNSSATGRTLAGYAAMFNSPTVIGETYREVIVPGAFASAFAEGYAGTSLAGEQRTDKAKREQLAAEQTGFERNLKTSAENRAINKDTREGTSSKYLDFLRLARGMGQLNPKEQGSLRYQDIAAFNTDFRKVNEAIQRRVRDGDLKAEDAKKMLEQEKARLLAQYTNRSVSGEVSPVKPSNAEPPPIGGVMNGWKRIGEDPADQNSWERVE